MPGLDALLRERPDRAARSYARFGITERDFRLGVSNLPIAFDDGRRADQPANSLLPQGLHTLIVRNHLDLA